MVKYQSAGRLLSGSQVCVEHLFDLQRSTPLRHFVALFAPVGSMSLDSQVATLPYESSSFATSRGRKERYGIYFPPDSVILNAVKNLGTRCI